MKQVVGVIGIAVSLVICPRPTLALQGDVKTNLDIYTNLQVLPEDVSRRELVNAMLENLRGLGLRRNRNEGCLHCHVGEFGQPTETWDFASDEKPAKQKARVMMRMVAAINGQHLTELPEGSRPPMRVTCYTCHAGRTNPRPLADVLLQTYDESGLDATTARYRELRQRYYAADAYDFRVGTLAGVAARLADRQAFDDAIGLLQLNLEFFSDAPAAYHYLAQMRLEGTLVESGIAAALERFHSLKNEDATGFSFALLDGLGWRYFRKGQRQDAIQFFQLNRAQYPENYVTTESLGDAFEISEDVPNAIRTYAEWVERHPEHERGTERLEQLRSGR